MRRASESAKSVLLVVDDGPTGRSWLTALETATMMVEWSRSFSELRTRTTRDDLPVPDAIFLDLELSDVPVEDLVPLVRASFPGAAVVALAGELSGERGARLLGQGVPSLSKPVSPLTLAGLALRLTMGARMPPRRLDERPSVAGRANLDSVFSAYSTSRILSKQQRMILRMYLDGMNDKEIAGVCHCSEATVYEHWRRMARKAGGSQKGDVIADFHRFLAAE
jgi:DNA-binding NarL/FixJ family response regulator